MIFRHLARPNRRKTNRRKGDILFRSMIYSVSVAFVSMDLMGLPYPWPAVIGAVWFGVGVWLEMRARRKMLDMYEAWGEE